MQRNDNTITRQLRIIDELKASLTWFKTIDFTNELKNACKFVKPTKREGLRH